MRGGINGQGRYLEMSVSAEVGLISVVIPFFQRKPGLLAAAVKSALNHKGGRDIRLVVVDDGSPIPASDELSFLPPDQWATVTVIRQINQGVAAARNAGLDALDESTELSRFWMPTMNGRPDISTGWQGPSPPERTTIFQMPKRRTLTYRASNG